MGTSWYRIFSKYITWKTTFTSKNNRKISCGLFYSSVYLSKYFPCYAKYTPGIDGDAGFHGLPPFEFDYRWFPNAYSFNLFSY